MNWLIRKRENKYMVGYFDPQDQWYALLHFKSMRDAVNQVHYLNGGANKPQDSGQEGKI